VHRQRPCITMMLRHALAMEAWGGHCSTLRGDPILEQQRGRMWTEVM
jgi:hypothetical protein